MESVQPLPTCFPVRPPKGSPGSWPPGNSCCPSDEGRLYIAVFALGPGSVDSEAGWPRDQSGSLISTSNSLRGLQSRKVLTAVRLADPKENILFGVRLLFGHEVKGRDNQRHSRGI